MEGDGLTSIASAEEKSNTTEVKIEPKAEIKEEETLAVEDSQDAIVDGLDAELKQEAENSSSASSANISSNPTQSQSSNVEEKVEFVLVGLEDGSSMMEIPLEEESLMSLQTLSCSFPGATGLKYKSQQSGFFRALRVDPSNKVHSPSEGWLCGPFVVIQGPTGVGVVHTVKRKQENNVTVGNGSKRARNESSHGDDVEKCVDLICLNVSFTTYEEQIKAYFEKEVGKVAFAQVKKNFDGRHAGFAFVQFKDLADQQKALNLGSFDIDGREVLIKVPESQGRKKRESHGSQEDRTYLRKVFVGRVTKEVTEEYLKEAFAQYGNIENVAISLNKNCAFVLFDKESCVKEVIGKELTINGVNVRVERAQPPKTHASIVLNQKERFFDQYRGGRPQQQGYDRRGPPDNRHGGYGGGGTRADYLPPQQQPQAYVQGYPQQAYPQPQAYATYAPAPNPQPQPHSYYDPYRAPQAPAPAPVANYGSYYPPRDPQPYYQQPAAQPTAPRPYEPPVAYDRSAADRGYATYR